MKKFLLPILLATLSIPATAQAAGFYLQEQSVAGQGSAFAGTVANPTDASTIFYNPAGMTKLSGPMVQSAANIIVPRASYKDNASTAGLSAGAQTALSGNSGGDPFEAELVPNLYAAMPLTDRVWFGVGVSAPFGLANEYDAGWSGRYDSTKSDLKTIDFSPVLAYRVNDKLSFGGGVNVQYAKAILESALPCPNVLVGCGTAFSAATDGNSRLEGDDISVGYNLSALWDVTEATTVGASYRSAITHTLTGVATVSGLGGALAGQNGARDASADLDLPNIASFGVSHDVNDRLKLLGSYNWYGWNNFKEIRVQFDNGDPDSNTVQNYKNSYSIAAGGEWKQTDKLTLRGGVQYDQTPTQDGDRTTRTPDGSRYWLSMGASYALNEHVSIDAAASHIFVKDGDIDLTKNIYGGGGALIESDVNLTGTTENKLDVVSVQMVWKF